MRKSPVIRWFTAGIMLAVFTLSIMPKLFLHTVFANHHDAVGIVTHTDQLGNDGFSCDINDLVATSPFTENNGTIEIPQLSEHLSFNVSYTAQVKSSTLPFFELRGPPMLG